MWREAEAVLKKDKHLGPLVVKYGPCTIRLRHKDNYFEDLAEAIVGQQLSVKAAATVYQRVLTKLGKITSEAILSTKDADLRACGLSWAKVSYVKDLAQRTKDKRLKAHKLDTLSDEEVRNELIAVKGIGKWTADMFLIFTLGRPDIFPIEDLGIRKGMQRLLKKDLTPEQMVKFAEKHWQPFRSIAAWYIWKLLDNAPVNDGAAPKAG